MIDGLWELPPDWEWKRFADVARVDSNLVDPALTPDLPHVAPNHMESGTGRLLPYSTVAADGVTSAKHRFRPGHIVYSKIRPYLAKAVLVDFEGLCSADCYPISTDLDPRFLHRWMVSPAFTEQASNTEGRTLLPKINKKELASLLVPVPRIDEQRRIVDRLHDLLGRVRRSREALASVPTLLDTLRLSVLDAAFWGGLTAAWREAHPDAEPAAALLERIRAERRRRFEEGHSRKGYVPPIPVRAGAEDLFEVPALWGWATLEELTDSTRLVQYGILKPGPDMRSGVPYVKVRNMKGEVIDVAGLSRTAPAIHAKYHRSTLRKGDLLISIRGSYGAVALVPDELDGANITQDSARIAPLPGVDRDFLRTMLRAPVSQAYFTEVAKGMAVRGVNIGDLRPTKVPLPPAPEQREIVRRVEADLASVRLLERLAMRAATDLASLERAILSKAFRGELLQQGVGD